MTDIRRFDLNLLLAFEALMSERSVTKAAARLGVGQPAMSYSLAQLRAQLDDELFVRVGAVMQPTPRALEFAGPVSRILSDIRSTVLSQSIFDPVTEACVFRIGASDQVQTALIPQLLTDFQTSAPNIQLIFPTIDPETTATALDAGAIDLAVGLFEEVNATQRREHLYKDELVCLFDADACGVSVPISIDDYCRLPHLMVAGTGKLYGKIDELLRSAGKERYVSITTQNFLVLPYILYGRSAIAAVPNPVARCCAHAMGLAVSPLPVALAPYDISMLWHLRMDRDPGHRWLRERLKAAAHQKLDI